MAAVLLAGLPGTDPIGETAVADAVAGALHGIPLRLLARRPNRRGSYPTVVASNKFAVARTVRASRAVVIAGSAVFDSKAEPEGPDPLRRSASLAMAAAAFGKPLALVGVSAGAVVGAAATWRARRVVRASDLLLLSDGASASALAGAGIPSPLRISADPVWVGLGTLPVSQGHSPSVAVALDGAARREVEAACAGALAAARDQGLRIRLVPWAGDRSPDAVQAGRIAAAVGGGVEIERAPADLAEARNMFAGAGAVVAMRYRALHAAAAAGVPVVAVGTDRAAAMLAERLGQRSFGPGDDAASIGGAIVDAVRRASAPSPAVVKGEAARAEAGFALLRLVLGGGEVDLAEVDQLPLGPRPWLG
ncbi:MAG: polysaccharide pyruvyl transferase family protein [Acidimicrobiales bacterium]